MTTILPTERLANLGYLALKAQVDGDTPITPTIYVPLYDDTLTTDLKLDLDSPIVGNRMKVFNAFMGKRDHVGNLNVLAEPNTAEYFFAMMLKAGTPTGGGPYTHPFTLDDPQTYFTIDLYKGQMVFRFFGVQADSIEPTFDKNKMQFTVAVTAKGSFINRTIASTSTGPDHVVFDTFYDPNPTLGLVAGDRIRLYAQDASAFLDTTVVSVVDGVTIEVADDPSAFVAGDSTFLRGSGADPAASLDILDPFLWTRTEFRFGTTASAALSAPQTNLETGSKWILKYPFEKKGGSDRSGSFDPVSLPRVQAEAQLTVKSFLDQPFNQARFLDVADRACVIRMFSGTDKELRITLDAMKQKTNKPPLKTGTLIYEEIEYEARWDTANVEGFGVTLINGLAT